MRNLLALGTLAAALALGVACTVHQTAAPALTGPSELATSVSITVTPDSISQDGASQSSVVVLAFDSNGQPLSGLVIRLDMQVNGVTQDFGTLSARTIVTGTNGKATSVYTAPPSSPAPSSGSGTRVSIVATVTGSNFQTAQSQFATIRLVPPGVILPPADTPTAKFSFSPTTPVAKQPTAFDASASCAGSAACSSTAGITNFVWNFGDGTFGSGVQPSHTFQLNGTFNVTLTVTNTGGVQASTSLGIPVGTSNAPTADFQFSPTAPVVGQTINFDASQARAGVGHSIASYAWNFGDGSSKTGVTTTHDYASAGTFNVTLTVTDEAGQATTVSHAVPVVAPSGGGGGGGATTAAFVASPTAPVVGQIVFFNAAGSTAATGHTLTSYAWNFGDGTSFTTANTSTSHTFTSPGSFTVALIVTDDTGQTANVTGTVTVTAAGASAPTATFTFSPAAPGVGETVFFNASTSVAGAGHSIASYAWTFGDGATGVGVTPTHAYSTAGSYSVQLKTTDEVGQFTTSTATAITIGNPPSPTANFTFSPASPGRNDQVVFDASSSTTAQGQTIVDVAWNYGDGTAVVHCGTLFGNDPSCVNVGVTNRVSAHIFGIPGTPLSGTFVVNLVVTDSAGRTGSKNVPVAVVPALPNVIITASPSSPNPGQTVSFNSSATTYYPGSGPSTFAWTFGDGGAGSALPNPTHSYAAVGTYTATLNVTDSKGRTGVGTVAVTVVAVVVPPPVLPVAAFTVSPPSPSLASPPVFFDASGSTSSAAGGITNYRWNFGDGTIISGPGGNPAPAPGGTFLAPKHTYAALGSYTVTLTVTDANGSGTTTQTVTVIP